MRKNLKFNQFFIPAFALVLSFLLVLLGTNYGFKTYMNKESDKHIFATFSSFNLYINDEKYWDDAFQGEEGDFLIPTHYIIFDEKNEIVDTSFLINNEKSEYIINTVSDFYKSNLIKFKDGKKLNINLPDYVFHSRVKTYYGYYDGYLLFEPSKSNDNHSYNILVFSDLSDINKFIKVFNNILILLMFISLFIALGIILFSAKRLSSSFLSLKEYIYKVGKRESLEQRVLPYEEFNDVMDTINQMSSMIDRAEDSQKSFFQNASHELRTPLMSIQGYAEAIKKGITDKDSSIDIILRESERMAKLVDEILFLSKLDSTKLVLNVEDTDINELIYSCAWTLKPKMDEKNIALDLDFDEKHIIAKVDEEMIEKLVLNILSNAIRYAKKSIRIKLSEEKESFRINIIDDGGKISKDDLEHIFERFYNGEEGNFGIGLSIAKEVVDLHKGEIFAELVESKTKFTIILPLES